MSTPAPNVEPAPKAPPKMSGMKTVLRYTGIPPSWLDKRPKLPSRNWLIFLTVSSTVVGYGVYDRRECKRIQQEYIEKVQALSENPLGPLELNRKVTVYGAKWPGDEDHQQALKYFRKYVKPVLVAAAVDFDMYSGKRLGDITKRVAEDVRLRRRIDEGIDQDPPHQQILPTYQNPAARRKRELEGGIVLIGRQTLKEYMAGLKKGWTEGLEKIDPEELLSQELENDHYFDEVDDDMPAPAEKPSYSPIFTMTSQAVNQKRASNTTPTPDVPPPATIPQQPPILLVPFGNRIGFLQIPVMIWEWFNKRHLAQSGAEAGYRLVVGATRPIDVPAQAASEFVPTPTDDETAPAPEHQSQGDLDFDMDKESLIKKSLNKIPEEVEKSRREYYEKLPAKLATARELFRGVREPTKDEMANPPPTEVELRAERMKNELRWRYDVEGWNRVKPGAPVAWDERFRDALRIFVDPPSSDSSKE